MRFGTLQSRGMHSAILPAEWEPAPCLRSPVRAVRNNPRAHCGESGPGRAAAQLSEQLRVILVAQPLRLYPTLRHSAEVRPRLVRLPSAGVSDRWVGDSTSGTFRTPRPKISSPKCSAASV